MIVLQSAQEGLAAVARDVKRNLDFCRAIYGDPRTPRLAPYLLAAPLAYAAMPIDLIPDFIPVIGQLDDLLIVPGLVLLALRSVPPEVYYEHRLRFFP